ncbi:MAG: sigma-70 family RNA polymerase sigma factor [Acidobacteria bacterium]|nr:sigma-70 family RNA polymerase sigma factor [Acidobacteriota bacterium]
MKSGNPATNSQSAGTSLSPGRSPGEAVPAEVMARLLQGKQRFLAFVEKRVGSREVAEDILQDAFVRGMERAGERGSDLPRDPGNEERATAWFYRVLRNAVIDHFRHQAAEQRALHGWAEDWERNASLTEAEEHEVCGCFREFLDLLKPEYRRAIEIVELQEGSLKDLSAQEDISPNNAAVRVHRARQALRQQIERACGVCAEHGCLDCHCKSIAECG